MAADDDRNDAFHGASFTGADFTGAKFRDCDLRQVKITDSWLVDVRVSGLVGNFVVNDVDVAAFVEGELDKRHPERVQLRELRTAGDYRAMWDRIERLWAETVARAGRLPEPALHQRSAEAARPRCRGACGRPSARGTRRARGRRRRLVQLPRLDRHRSSPLKGHCSLP